METDSFLTVNNQITWVLLIVIVLKSNFNVLIKLITVLL